METGDFREAEVNDWIILKCGSNDVMHILGLEST
jgi:hypothetical protein